MRKHRKSVLILLIICMSAVTTVVGLRGQAPDNRNSASSEEKLKLEFESQFPIADYNQTEVADPQERIKRSAKSKLFNGHKNDINENIEVISSSRHWADKLPALPVLQSDAVIIGKGRTAKAFITDENSAVYSEFEIEVREVLKNDNNLLSLGSLAVAEREGGRVKTPSGRIGISFTDGMGMPRLGKQYVFFLTHNFPYGGKREQDYYILTAYELDAEHIRPIDNPGGGTHPIARYTNADKTTFLNELRSAIEHSVANPQN
jgi:hypothetical protein